MADNIDLGLMNRYETNTQREAYIKAKEAKSGSGTGGSWMMALAMTLGKLADQMGENIANKATEIDSATNAKHNQTMGNKFGSSSSHGIASLNAELQVMTQQFSMFMGAISNLLKTAGEGAKSLSSRNG